MRRVGQARRRDANEPAIVRALEAIGAHVTRISGEGAPDILVRYKGILVAFEVKSAKGKRTEAQTETAWPIVRSVEDVLQQMGIR
jgi:Holliday junction resolvase